MNDIDWKEAAECLKMLAHPMRLKIIALLLKAPYSVGELAEKCDLRQNVISEHLNLMKHKGFLRSEREGRRVYYSIQEPSLTSIMKCIQNRFTKGKI